MDDDDDATINITSQFEDFKEKHPSLENVDIDLYGSSPITFSFTVGRNYCMTIDINHNHMRINDVKHCGANISLLLQFLREIIQQYELKVIIEDASRFEFVNRDDHDKIYIISLKPLYELAEGESYYNKYLMPGKTEPYPTIPIGFFQENLNKFTNEENEKIEEMKTLYHLATLGDLFKKIRQLLKANTTVEEETKYIDDSKWNDLKLYESIIRKTYDLVKSLNGKKKYGHGHGKRKTKRGTKSRRRRKTRSSHKTRGRTF
jgi:hypothetical protein